MVGIIQYPVAAWNPQRATSITLPIAEHEPALERRLTIMPPNRMPILLAMVIAVIPSLIVALAVAAIMHANSDEKGKFGRLFIGAFLVAIVVLTTVLASLDFQWRL
jgi:hypothetical protein